MRTLDVNRRIRIPLSEFEFTFARSSGPGGQNVNKVNSKAVLRWPIKASTSLPNDVRERFLQKFAGRITTDGELVLSSQQFRDQPRNVADCLDKLRAMLLAATRIPTKRKATKPSRAMVEQRLQQKQKRAKKKRARTERNWEAD